jgi:hypothetical protein
MAENSEIGSCAWPKCNKKGKDWQDGKCYCERHYALVENHKPVGRAGIGSATVPNEG